MTLDFLTEAANVVLFGPNGVGKTTIARNFAHQAVLAGHTVLFVTAGMMLSDLAAQDGDSALKRRLNRYVRPKLLVIDELGYLSYSNRYADLLNAWRDAIWERYGPNIQQACREEQGGDACSAARQIDWLGVTEEEIC